MKGQWIGNFTGTNTGLAMLDLDDEGDFYSGTAVAFDDNPELPSTVVKIVTENKDPVQSLKITDIAALRPGTTALRSIADIESEYPGLKFPREINLKLEHAGANIEATWSTDVGTEGKASLPKSCCDDDSDLVVSENVTDWNSYKAYVCGLPHRQFIFRGQGERKRLRSTFHRTSRRDLVRYVTKDVPEAHRVLSSKTRHLFDLMQGAQNAAFLNLLQHHGFPTPLLDWTHSPFVAAFFAYRFPRKRKSGNEHVRIFIFDKVAWEADWLQVQSLMFARPHFSLLEALSLENQRAIPQQALLSATNVDDVERYIREREQEKGKSYLLAVDLPVDQRREVMEELSMMGITAGSLFPGLDGACEELKGRFFGYNNIEE